MITAIYKDNTTLEFPSSGNIIGQNFRKNLSRPKYFISSRKLKPAETEYLKRYVVPI